MIVLLGEVGGTEEYDVCSSLQTGLVNKPVVAWCIGTCACKLEIIQLITKLLFIYIQHKLSHFKVGLNLLT